MLVLKPVSLRVTQRVAHQHRHENPSFPLLPPGSIHSGSADTNTTRCWTKRLLSFILSLTETCRNGARLPLWLHRRSTATVSVSAPLISFSQHLLNWCVRAKILCVRLWLIRRTFHQCSSRSLIFLNSLKVSSFLFLFPVAEPSVFCCLHPDGSATENNKRKETFKEFKVRDGGQTTECLRQIKQIKQKLNWPSLSLQVKH